MAPVLAGTDQQVRDFTQRCLVCPAVDQPDDRSRVRLAQVEPETGRGAVPGDGRAVKQERDHLPQIGAVAAQQVVTLRAHDLLHPLQGAFHEVPDHAGRTIEHALDQPDVVGQAQVIVTQACHAPT